MRPSPRLLLLLLPPALGGLAWHVVSAPTPVAKAPAPPVPTPARSPAFAPLTAPAPTTVPFDTEPDSSCSPSPSGASFSPPPRPATAPISAEANELPLAVVASDYAAAYTPAQTEAMGRLAEDFLIATAPAAESLAESGKPTRRAKSSWQRAQEENDARFQAMFGQDAFNAMQRERAAQLP